MAVLAVTRLGILTTQQLRKGRGYAILGIAVLAAVATPTPDPVTMTLAMGPLILLYEASILLARWLDHVSPRVSRWRPGRRRGGSTTTRRRSRSTGATTAVRVTTERTDPPMLFDLRGKGRRRTVQVIYLGLAILMGGGLVLFGIGGATSGGLFDAINGNSGSGSTSDATAAIERTETTAQAATVANPKDAAAWARLVKARFQLAGANEGVDANGTWTAAGKKRLVPVEQAWDRYVALEPDPPDDTVAGYMVQAFAPTGLDKPDKAVRALEMIIDVRGGPDADATTRSNLYTQLAVLRVRRRTRCARATSRPTGPCRWRRRASASSCARTSTTPRRRRCSSRPPRPRRHRPRRRRAPRRRPANLSAPRPYSSTGRAADS